MNIVILHGWGHSAQMWDSFASKFHGHKVTVLNLPGFGNEKLISPNWGIDNYSKWVVKKLKGKKLTNIALIGHSFGGKIATEVAITNPKLVNKLVLIAAPVLRRPSVITKIKTIIHKITKRVILRNATNVFTNEEYRNARMNNMGKIFIKSVQYDASTKLTNVKTPTLIIWGEDDRDAPLFIGKEMAKLIPNAKLEILKSTGHNVYIENPNILYGLIQNFISN